MQRCLQRTGARVLTPSDAAFAAAAAPLNTRILRRSAMVTFARHTADVQAAVRCGAAHGVRVVPRGGGHSYEGETCQEGTVLLDLKGLRGVSVAADGIATVGAGTLLGPLQWALWERARRVFSAGACPTVGIAGVVLVGGIGPLIRKHGVASDHLLAVELVDARGEIVVANATHNPELLWALRGGGPGGLGIVMSLTLQTQPDPGVITMFELHWRLPHAAVVAGWFLERMHAVTVDLSAKLLVFANNETWAVQLAGVFIGTPETLRQLLQAEGVDSLPPPVESKYKEMTFIDAALILGNLTVGLSPVTPSSLNLGPETSMDSPFSFKAKARFLREPLSPEGLAVLQEQMDAGVEQGPFNGWIQFLALGGAMNAVPVATTAFPHRNKRALLQAFVSWQHPGDEPRSMRWLRSAFDALVPYMDDAAYAGYPDDDNGAAAEQLYFGSNAGKLQRLRTAHASPVSAK